MAAVRALVLASVALAPVGACGFDVAAKPTDARTDALDASDAPPDSPPDAMFAAGPFGAITLVPVSEDGARDDDVTLTGDMLEMFFESDRLSVVSGEGDIFTSRRTSVNDTWPTPVIVDELTTPHPETSVEVSRDGLTIYLSSARNPTLGASDIWVATRTSRTSRWSNPTRVDALSSTRGDHNAQPYSDQVLFLGSDRISVGSSDIFRATRAGAMATWGSPQPVTGLSTSAYEAEPFADTTLAMWFTSLTNGTDQDIYRAEPVGDAVYGPPRRIDELAGPSGSAENDAWVSPDGKTIYFTSDRAGSLDIYMATR